MVLLVTSAVFGVVGALIADIFGGFPAAAWVLLAFMAIDYITGILCAYVFKKSPKTESGAGSSRVALTGFARKVGTLCLYLVGILADKVIGGNVFANFIAIGLMFAEATSITENVGLMGVKIPNGIRRALDVLREKAAEEPQVETNEAQERTDMMEGDEYGNH